MQIIVMADASQKAELLATLPADASVTWIDEAAEFSAHKEAAAFIDLLFINTPERMALLGNLLPMPVVVNSVVNTVDDLLPSFVRINGWPTFLSGSVLEGACLNDGLKKETQAVFQALGKQVEWVPDTPGFVTARVVSMIVNEAYMALADGVSTQDEINTAMKLGTAYPYGPFEWADKIGVQNIVTLLQKLSGNQPRYTPAALLVQETEKAI